MLITCISGRGFLINVIRLTSSTQALLMVGKRLVCVRFQQYFRSKLTVQPCVNIDIYLIFLFRCLYFCKYLSVCVCLSVSLSFCLCFLCALQALRTVCVLRRVKKQRRWKSDTVSKQPAVATTCVSFPVSLLLLLRLPAFLLYF